MTKNVLGIDGSLTAPGFAFSAIGVETLHTDRKRGDRRLLDIRDRTRYYVRRAALHAFPYDLAAIEGLGFDSTRVVSSAMVHSQVRGVLLEHGVPYALIAPTTLKCFATGDSKATKSDMLAAARQASGINFGDDNQVDAWWLRRMGLAAVDVECRRGLNDAQIERLGHVQWPLAIEPYGPNVWTVREPKIEQCRHGHWCLLNSGRWLHPLLLDVCTRPPK